ncbi:hypothetical protein FHS18_004027 [Paenibacillus phyllosphaerae]|uniref:Uncharacterized protein n=1 Tax=Paenibacillus phyllosphaerae TaxID=274593 RepID=A0A7W5FPE5_9BACL|nr:hypothetical protein [Paenibacillus phyllosphaerae]MBB3111959.1 hypothetical protein [Paenibacillus phyllosphaerae]
MIERDYHIRGTTFTGVQVNETSKAKSAKHALGLIQKKYGKLKNPYDIYTVSKLADGGELPEEESLKGIPQLLAVEDILRITNALRENGEVDSDEYRLFRNAFKPMITPLLQDYWNDVTILTKEELEEELYADIINEFLPKYNPERGRLFGYLKMKLRSRIKRNWKREKYVNAEKASAKAKYEILDEYARGISVSIELYSREQEKNEAMLACKRIYTEKPDMSLPQRRAFYSWIVRLGLHHDLLRSEQQIAALELIYGPDELTEGEAARRLSLSQATIHINKSRGEANILKNGAKKSL